MSSAWHSLTLVSVSIGLTGTGRVAPWEHDLLGQQGAPLRPQPVGTLAHTCSTGATCASREGRSPAAGAAQWAMGAGPRVSTSAISNASPLAKAVRPEKRLHSPGLGDTTVPFAPCSAYRSGAEALAIDLDQPSCTGLAATRPNSRVYRSRAATLHAVPSWCGEAAVSVAETMSEGPILIEPLKDEGAPLGSSGDCVRSFAPSVKAHRR